MPRCINRRIAGLGGAVCALSLLMGTPAALASHQPQVPPHPELLKDLYHWEGHFKAGSPVPAANAFGTAIEPHMEGLRFNPSGEYNAFDTNVFEVLALPWRAAGDEFSDDPYGNGGDPDHGQCGGDPRSDRPRPGSNGYPQIAGECPNHQREYIEYFEDTMKDILGDFGVTFHRYEFWNPTNGGSDQFQPALLSTNTMGGRAVNPAAIVPGAEHPEQTVVIGAHYDQTNDGPASAWDSQEGHAQIIRVAKIMADYWEQTGSRPAATVKFIPWDGEESGTLGSAEYAAHVIPPGDEELNVRGYWNTDPCAGGYPAFRFGDPADRVQLGIQLANPERADDIAGVLNPANFVDRGDRIKTFNDAAEQVVEDVFTQLDDKLTVAGQQRDIFVASSEATTTTPSDIGDDATAGVRVGTGRAILFSSDWLNFENRGIPFFNPGPEITGPGTQGDPGNPDALAILHTPNDNIQTLNAYSGGGSGSTFSEGWMKGMEMCAHLLAWGMLRADQGGAQLLDDRVIAYYEALPNEAALDEPVHFDASGSHQRVAGVPQSAQLELAWEFGDGTTGSGRDAYHRYVEVGTFQSKLTVTNPATGESATMAVPITVGREPTKPLTGATLDPAPAEDEDGMFDLSFSVRNVPSDVTGFEVLQSSDFGPIFSDDAQGDLAGNWTASLNSTNSRVKGWQKTSDQTQTMAGNKFHSPSSSFWTGIFPSEPPAAFESILTLKEPLTLPPGDAALSYWTYYRNDLTDVATVEVATDDGDPETPPDWQVVDRLRGDDYVAYHPPLDAALNGQPGLIEPMYERRADLSQFAGENVLIRFRGNFTTRDGVFIQRHGWYVDDITVTAGSFHPLGRTTQVTPSGQGISGTFTVSGQAKGDYAYSVRALYPPGDYAGPASNVRAVSVTTGPPPPPDDGDGDGDGDGNGGDGNGGGTPDGTGGSNGSGGVTGGGAGGGTAIGGSSPPEERVVPVAFAGGRTVSVRGGREIPVALGCPAASSRDCAGVLTLYAGVRGGRTAARVKLGSKRFRIAPGRTSAVRVRVRTKARRLLARGGRLRVTAVAVPEGQAGPAVRRTLVVRAGRTRRR